jgi:formylglycine-generating enzyme required for sulfatase activity
MGRVKWNAQKKQLETEEEWEQQQRALLLSQGHTHDEVNDIIEEMINEYQNEMAQDYGDWENTHED